MGERLVVATDFLLKKGFGVTASSAGGLGIYLES